MLLGSILVALWVTWGLIDEQTIQLQTTRPIITGAVVGLILGDFKTGLIVGAMVELMFLAVVFVGTGVPPDTTMAAAIATAFAIFAGGGTEVAIAAALPIAVIGGLVSTLQYSVINVLFESWAEKLADKADVKGITRVNKLALLGNFVLYGIPTFLAVYFGSEFVMPLVEKIPQNIIAGLGVGGGMIGAVGFAMLIQSISNKKVWPYFIVGYVCSAFLGINMLGVGVVAVAAVFLHNYFTANKTLA
ncbi:MAG: PTS sugar transporter subunit IIC [Anaerolineaceae bacterium]|jgi:mannose/fructose/N-acetylgalactosamine-specific phosphotransferase system component IIC|nr:PTS sugar transporter subunit IIC [Anaerolineaceae bacterium]MDI9531291.1 PTS sugar transporter subunit IIC [Chloroflexota bacterium]